MYMRVLPISTEEKLRVEDLQPGLGRLEDMEVAKLPYVVARLPAKHQPAFPCYARRPEVGGN